MAVNITQNTDQGGVGITAFQSNTNSKVPLILNDNRGAYFNRRQFVELYDDFLGDVIADEWSAAKGSDAQAVIATVQAGVAGGVVRQTTGDSTVVAESAVSLTHGLNWRADQGGLYMYCRFKPVTSVADVSYFIGFTDTLATTTLEEPITISGTTLTTNATDAVGFVFDTSATNDTWHCQGVANNVDTAINNTGLAPAADTWVDLEIELSTTGAATFWINGTQVASVASAVTATVALTPAVVSHARTTTSKSHDVGVIHVLGQRPA